MFVRKKMRCLAMGALTVALTMTTPTGFMQEHHFAAEQSFGMMPTGGLMDVIVEQAIHVATEDTPGNTFRSIRPELGQYDWDCYSNDYYYSKLTSKEQQLYERLDAACGELLTSSTCNAQTYSINGVKRRGTKEVSTLGLTLDQVKKVQTLFVYANPQYYFLNTILFSTNNNTCALGIYDAFGAGNSRATATAKVQACMEELQNRIEDHGCVYETEAQIHDLLCKELTYMKGENVLSDKTDPYYTQTIYGALTTKNTVCAGYTKLYVMLCNYFGIDCISVTSHDHAWNQVRYGDNWYLVDVTWDDTWDRGKYFHITDARMRAIDQDNSHVMHSFYDGLRPVANTEFSGDLMLARGLDQPVVEVKDTATGVMITMRASEGEIYYTLDGTVPDAADRYTEPIELTDGGTYIVTAVTAGDGYLSSAYEIFLVRIAGGRVSFSSATNISGKKIKLKLKSSKTYTGYEIAYSAKRDFSQQKKAKIQTKAATISGLKKGKTYYVRVRGYKKDVYGNIYYTPFSTAKAIKITK